ncbi:MAG: type II toxin-antitoxin system VapC family toxin [Acidobacteriaceae bacterium]|nr:type II toxin-antitoxin system VapC family toxin [Acidobacteriaceae bacterium]MBV9033394.1 type II toxin-antitoxin system VapC family toxin [Acidobacteriaceae bacterium]MBV9308731.1 type II toxin-antitoxin system VapC family toxin [Acidobacteriaceae bacterium]
MTLVDTSTWIEHFRKGVPHLAALLEEGSVLIHPFVIGELACGNLKSRSQLLGDLHQLPSVQLMRDDEVLELVERRKLWGRGLGWVDMHLLASALFTGCVLWTADRSLKQAAIETGISVTAPEYLQ